MTFTRFCRTLTLVLAWAWAGAALGLGQTSALGQEVAFPRQHHPWGRFPHESWKQVRTIVETLDEKGRVAGITVTHTHTKLLDAGEDSFTLRTGVTVEVAGRRIAATPLVSRHGYYGEAPGQGLSVKRVGEAALTIDGRSIPCELRQVSLARDGLKMTNTMHYSPQVAPHVLRREATTQSGAEGQPSMSLIEVVALNLPHRVRGEVKLASYIKTTQDLPQGPKVTLEVHCDEVPGGVVAHWASESDADGRVLRRSTLELIDYGLPAPAPRAVPVIEVPRRMHRATKAGRRLNGR